jgi:hypothetical protein
MQFVWTHTTGPSGSWSAPAVGFTDNAIPSPYEIEDASLVADRSGNLVYIVNSENTDGSEQLRAWRYEPASGWQAPVVINPSLSNTRFFSTAVDQAGDIIVAFNAVGASTYVYSAASKSWGTAPAVISRLGSSQYVPTFQLVSNADGTAIYAIYGIANWQIYSTRFDPSRFVWQTRHAIPLSRGASATVSAVVDDDGVVSALYFGDKASRTVKVSRTRNGYWSLPTTVLDVTGSPASVNLGQAVTNHSNNVLVPMMAVNTATTAAAYVERWNGSAWTTEITAQTVAGYNFSDFRSSVAWSGAGGAAVMLYSFNGQAPLSIYNDGSSGWSAAAAALPNPVASSRYAVYTNSSSNPSATSYGVPLAIYEGPPTAGLPGFYSHQASWMQN